VGRSRQREKFREDHVPLEHPQPAPGLDDPQRGFSKKSDPKVKGASGCVREIG
jgi:hypothetical protein